MYCGANKYIDINEGSTVGGQRPYTRVATAKSAFIQGIEATYRAGQASAQSDRLALPQDAVPVPPWEWCKEKRPTSESQSGSLFQRRGTLMHKRA